MKIKLSTNQIFALLVTAYIIYIVTLSLLGISNPVWKSVPNGTFYSDNLQPIDTNISDTLPFNQYNKLKDSTIIIRSLKNGDGFLRGGAANLDFFLGTWSSLACDTCSLKWFNKHVFETADKSHILYYVKLPAWTLKIKKNTFTDTYNSSPYYTEDTDSVQFYVKDNQAYVRKLINKKLSLNSSYPPYRTVDIPVNFRYNTADKCLMIPISETTKNILNIAILMAAVIWLAYVLYLIIQFIKFIIDLSRGYAFTDDNITRLKLISLSLLIYPLVTLLFNILLKLIFHDYFSSDVILSNELLNVSWKIILLGIIFFMLYRAFKQGKALKDEQELTI